MPRLLLRSPKSPFHVSSLIQLAGCLASLMILLVILATGFLFESLPQVCSLDLVWGFLMYRDFAILFVYIFVAVSWVFTVTLVRWYEKGPRLGSISCSTVCQQLGPRESRLSIFDSQFLDLQSGGVGLANLQGSSLFDLLWPYTPIKNLRWPTLIKRSVTGTFNLVELRNAIA